MKKFSFILPLLIVPFLASCESTEGKTQLTYGTYMHEEAVQLSSSEFSTHFNNEENFLMAIYPKDSTCFCWKYFSEVINQTVKDEHLLIYKFYANDVDDNVDMKEVGGFNNRMNAPTFYIIKNKKIARYYNYSDAANFFKKKDEFVGEISNHIKKPRMFYLSKEQVDAKLENKETFSLFYARNECGDCNYVIPHTLVPYFDSLERETNELYIFDMQPYYAGSSASEEEKAAYQEFKDHYLLSEAGNATYGFGKGVVPTFHYYEAGLLADACVYANDDALTYDNGVYHPTGSYYNASRLDHLHYLREVEVSNLTTIEILEEDTVTYENSHYWKISSASSYYNPILIAFLDAYL